MKTTTLIIAALVLASAAAFGEVMNLAPKIELAAVTQVTSTTDNNPTANTGTTFMGTVGGIIGKIETHLAYLQSFGDAPRGGLALVGNYPIIESRLPAWLGGKKLAANIDFIGFMDEGIDGGIGGSISIPRVLDALNVGIGYVPSRGYDLSWYVGVAKVF